MTPSFPARLSSDLTIGATKTVVLKIAERHQAFEQDRSARLRPFQRSGYFGNAGFALNRVKILEDTQNPARRFNDRWFATGRSCRHCDCIRFAQDRKSVV